MTMLDPDGRVNCAKDVGGVERVRRLREVADVRVIFLSAWAQELQEELRGTEREAQDYIQLPFAAAELTQSVRLVLEQRLARD